MLALADFAVTVRDAQASARWWQEKMGFGVYTIGGGSGHALLVAPPGERFLLHLCEGIEPVEAGNTGIAFMTDDLEAEVRRMEEADIGFTEPLRGTGLGASAKFADPDGNVFWLIGAPARFIREQTEKRAPLRTKDGSAARSARPKSSRARRD